MFAIHPFHCQSLILTMRKYLSLGREKHCECYDHTRLGELRPLNVGQCCGLQISCLCTVSVKDDYNILDGSHVPKKDIFSSIEIRL